MDFLNISAESEGSPKKFKKYRGFIGIGVIAAAVGLGSTLAANININAGPVEFGQGVAQTVSCSGDQSVIVTPATSFSNAPSSVTRQAISGGGDTLTVSSSTDISIGMWISSGGFFENAVVTEIDGNVLTISGGTPTEGTELTAIFTPSTGTEQSISTANSVTNDADFAIGSSSMNVDTVGVEEGMLVSGPGIYQNTVVVFAQSGEGQYLEFNKDIDYTSGELTFTNSGQSSFELSDITVSNIPDTCTNKVFTIKLYDNESSEPLQISNWGMGGDNSVQVWWANGYEAEGGYETNANAAVVQFPADNNVWGFYNTDAYNSGPAIETNATMGSSIAGGTFKVYLPVMVDASRVYKITLESQDDSDSFNVGDDEVEGPFSFYEWWNDDY